MSLNYKDSPQGIVLEVEKTIVNQVFILITTVTEDNWKKNLNQIEFIIDSSSESVKVQFYNKVINLLILQYQDTIPNSLTPLEKLLKGSLKYFKNIKDFAIAYSQFAKLFDYIPVFEFISKFDCSPEFGLFLAAEFIGTYSTDTVERVLDLARNFIKLAENCSIGSKKALVDSTLFKKDFPLSIKTVLLTYCTTDKDIQNLEPSLELLFYEKLSTMSFKDSLIELGGDLKNFNPNALLQILLKIDPKEIDLSLALIISEILIPGSQKLPANPLNDLTSVNTLPESTAKGSQLQVCFKSIDSNPAFTVNWYLVFSRVQELLFDSSKRNILPSIININEFLAAIDFKNGLLDIFLNYDWYFSKNLLFIFHSLDPKQGAYDINSLPNLTKCFDDEIETPIETQLGKKNIISFINIGKLELHVMSQIVTTNAANKDPKSIDAQISKIFDYHCHTFPEYLISACLATADKNSFVINVIDTLFSVLVDNDSKFLNQVLQKFKELDNNLALRKLMEYFGTRNNTESLLKIAKISLDLNFTEEVFSSFKAINPHIAISFIINASVWGYDFKQSLEAMYNEPNIKKFVVQAVLETLEIRSTEDFEKGQDPNFKILKVATVYYLLGILTKNTGLFAGERLKSLQLQLLTTYPRLINFGCGHDEAILANDRNSNSFPEAIEQEMKAYYSKMYNKELDIRDIVDMLINLKNSNVPHDQDLFACMIHSLLDEYRFFPEYPLSALASTSLLFGALLQKDIIQGTTLTVALNFIWESCNQPQESHLFKFAVQALYNFKSRLHEYPNYCKHLLECKSLSAHAKMYQIVQDAANGIPCVDTNRPNSSNSSGQPMVGKVVDENSGTKYQSIAFTEQAIGLAAQEKPNESTSDKLLFFVNNLTGDNLKTKLPEVKDNLTENFYLWFADYLVGDRAKSEPNNHQLYSELVKEFDDPIFYEYILNVSLREVSYLVRNFKDNSTERSHLKNLGSWLGQITLAADRPLKRTQIGLKFLLVEAFDFKTLPHIIPFVCKILDQAQYSKIFKPPNPWVLGILKVLVELYDCADLKLNLKFEIEVLLNSFHMKVSDIEPSTIVRNHNPDPATLAAMFGVQPTANSLSNDFAKMGLDSHGHPTMPHAPSLFPPAQFPQQMAQAPQQHQIIQPLAQAPQQPRVSEDGSVPGSVFPPPQQPQAPGGLDTSFSTLVGNTIFTQNPNLRRAFQASLSRAVRECAIPILSRTSESVLTTTEALIKKDFAYEADVNKFRKSYQTLALRLSQNMIACSGRKILSETIEATMVQLLAHQINPNDLPLGELNSAIQSNVDLCVDIVNKIAAGNIIELIEDRMKPSVLHRENHKPGEPFVEPGASNYALRLPPPLGLGQSLSPNQLSLYETFGMNIIRPDMAASAQQAGGRLAAPLQHMPQAPVASQIPAPQPPRQQSAPSQVPAPQTQNPHTPQQHIPRLQQDETTLAIDQLFTVITQNCDRVIQSLSETQETSLSALTNDHPIMTSVTNVLALSQANALKYPELLLKVAQYAVNCLFTQAHDNPIGNEIFVVILDKLCEYSPSTAKDVTWWLVHSSDQRKLNIAVMHSLLKVQLVQPSKLDSSIGKLISETHNPLLIKFASSLLENVFSAKELKPIALRSEFAITLDLLSKFKVENESNQEELDAKETRDRLFDLLNNTSNVTDIDMFTQLGQVFSEWVKLCMHGEDDNCKELKGQFIKGLYKNGILTDSDLFSLFFKSSIEIAIAAFTTEHEIRSRTQHETILTVDALAAIIVEIITKFDKDHVKDALTYFQNIMGVILMSFTNDHELPNGSWNERAYYRFFSSLLCCWNEASVLDANATKHMDSEFYNFFGDIFNSLQPIVFPGFAFAWISLISHRMFLPRLLELPNKSGHNTLVKILSSLLRFEEAYAKDESVNNDVINVIFKAINRIFVGLYHDNPEFLAENYLQLLSSVPSNYIHLRNIILSATPKQIPLENPFTPGLKVERIEELKSNPAINFQPTDDLNKHGGLKRLVDNYLRIPSPGLIKSVYNVLKLSHPKMVKEFGFDTVNYNVDLINSLVLYVTISETQDKSTGFNPKGSHVAFFYDLLNHGSAEFKYHLINALANQLRYPNTHTHWLVGIFLHLFNLKTSWINNDTKLIVQEIITRVLIERHMVNKPHQWGLTILFTELIKNGSYNFFQLPFVKNAPKEIKLIFDALLNNVNGS